MGKPIKTVDLHHNDMGHDKVYHVLLEDMGSGYNVRFCFGRRGSTLNHGTKTTAPVSLARAEAIYSKLLGEKLAKGYHLSNGISGNVFGITARDNSAVAVDVQSVPIKKRSGILPQLLNPCSEEEAFEFIDHPAWGAMEKLDGKRLIVRSEGDGSVLTTNKQGIIIPTPPDMMRALRALERPVTLDGESIGDTLMVFGMLNLDGEDMRLLPYGEMYAELANLLRSRPSPNLSLVGLAKTQTEKRALLARLQADKREGIVFKLLSAPYSAGRPASGGDQRKWKFTATLSCICVGINEKRSVKMAVLSNKGDLIQIGNVTIPVNKNIPPVGAIIEIRYLYYFKGGALFQPAYLGIRDDIGRKECLESQLKYKSEDA